MPSVPFGVFPARIELEIRRESLIAPKAGRPVVIFTVGLAGDEGPATDAATPGLANAARVTPV